MNGETGNCGNSAEFDRVRFCQLRPNVEDSPNWSRSILQSRQARTSQD